MRKSKKITALLLTACMGAALMTGCGDTKDPVNQSSTPSKSETSEAQASTEEQQDPALDTSEHVTLTMYCIGDEGGIHAQEHLDKLNEVLKEKINVTLEPIMVSWGDYKTKLPMVWASGEAYDLTYTSNWTGYFTEADKGAFMDITELFPTYAPKTYEEYVAKDYLETTKVNDKLYMVPNDIPDYTTFVYNYREDLRKKYDCPEIVDMETFETFLAAIKEKEPSMLPFANNSSEAFKFHTFLNEQDWSRPVEQGNGVYVYDLKDATKVFNVVETPEYEEFINKMREYYEKGYWSQSIMAETTASKELFLAGQTAACLGNTSTGNGLYQEMGSQHPDWEIGIFSSDMASGTVERIAASNNGVAVGAYSKHPERAMMFIELCYQDEEVYDILMNGLEGVTYEADKATMTKWIPEGVDPSDITLKNLGMGFGTSKYYLGSKNDSPLVNQLKEDYDKIAVFPELAGFAINQDSISAELAALKSVCDEYKLPLEKGVVDPVEGLAQLRQKLKDAGVDKVMEEINNQIAAYLAK